MIDQAKWDRRFLDLARFVSGWSRDPSTKVGAVVARGKHELVLGYNGFPAGHDDSPHLYSDREYKLKHIIHGERNALAKAEERGICVAGATLYTWPFQPCSGCVPHIIEANIARVVAPVLTGERLERWGADMEEAALMLRWKGIEVTLLEVPT